MPAANTPHADGLSRQNPEGWREVDGVMLPPITWGTVCAVDLRNLDQQTLDQVHTQWMADHSDLHTLVERRKVERRRS